MLLCASAMDPSRRIEDAVVTERTYPRQGRTPFNALARQPFPSVRSRRELPTRVLIGMLIGMLSRPVYRK
jgi:hypothetical protein